MLENLEIADVVLGLSGRTPSFDYESLVVKTRTEFVISVYRKQEVLWGASLNSRTVYEICNVERDEMWNSLSPREAGFFYSGVEIIPSSYEDEDFIKTVLAEAEEFVESTRHQAIQDLKKEANLSVLDKVARALSW